ncbi:MAG: dehydrogenase [Verrucomicrobiales bacterium]|nr:dehydrogenase [Verrucomicrobiales bacterium]
MRRRKFIWASAGVPFVLRGAKPPRIKAGQIGLGHPHALGKLRAIQALGDDYELVGVVEPDESRRRSVQGVKFMSEEELLNAQELQMVAVETRVRDLVPAAKRVVANGQHIHLDKPAGPSMAEFRELVGMARGKNLTLQMGYMLRYNPAFEFMFRAVREGWFGEIMEIDAMMGKLGGAAMRKELAQFPGGGFFELACHILDAAVYIMGKPSQIHGITRRTGAAQGDSFADNQLAVLEYEKATVCLRCNHNDPFGFPRRRFNIAGTKGGMEIQPLESGKFALNLDRPRGAYKKGSQTVQLKGGRSYKAEFADLAKVVRGEKKLAWTYQHDLTVHETLLEICGMADV